MKLGSWAYEFSLKTIRVDPSPEEYSSALGDKQLIVYFTKEKLIPLETESNKMYYSFIIFLCDIIHKTISIISLNKFLKQTDFQQTIAEMLTFLVCEKRFALQTWCDQFTDVLFMESILFSLMRFTKYFLYFHQKLVDYSIAGRGHDQDTILREITEKLPIDFEILDKLIGYLGNETKQIIRKTKSKFNKGYPYLALLKLNSLMTLYSEMGSSYLKGYICGDNNWNRMVDVLDNVDVFLNTGDILKCLVATGELKMLSRSMSDVSENDGSPSFVG